MKITNAIKRVIDLFLSASIFIILLPIIFIIGLMILMLEGRPIFYISERMISPVKKIRIYKFRTMVKNATSPIHRLNERFMRDGYLDIPLDCEVYTPIGRILERTQLVEIFQTINILMSQMSFVGNRPLPKGNLEFLKKFSGWEARFSSPCGITGIAQIAGKYTIKPAQRMHLEIMYSSIYTSPNGNIILCDALIIWHTIVLLLTGRYLGLESSLALLIRCGANFDLQEKYLED